MARWIILVTNTYNGDVVAHGPYGDSTIDAQMARVGQALDWLEWTCTVKELQPGPVRLRDYKDVSYRPDA